MNQPAVSEAQLLSSQTAREVTRDIFDAHNAIRWFCLFRDMSLQNAKTAHLLRSSRIWWYRK